jgi:hypothetical protein
VKAKPRATDVERRHERAAVVELLQDPLRARAARQRVRQRAADPLEHGRPQQQIAHLRRLALQDLGSQISRDGALAARELAHETLGIGVCRELRGGESQTADPALAALVKQRHTGIRQRDARALEELPRLLEREAQFGSPELGQRAREPQSVQTKPHRGAGQQHHAQLRRHPVQEALELRPPLGRSELVQIVDHQHGGLLQSVQA